jgi:hypothetical protein
MKRAKIMGIALAVVAVAAIPAWAVVPTTLIPWTTINGTGGASSQNYGWVLDGTTSYHALGTNGRITKVTDFAGTPVTTELMSTAAWQAASGLGTPSMTAFYGFGMSGNYLQFSESASDAVWRVDKTSGAVAPYVSKSQIQSFTGAAPALGTQFAVAPNGEHVFRDGTSLGFLTTTGPGTVGWLVTSTDLSNLMGNTNVSGGLGYDLSGSLYWGSGTSGAIYKRAADGTLSQVLDQAALSSVAGSAVTSFGAFEGISPDGWVYFFNNSGKNIMKFDPASPASTLAMAITTADLLASPGASSTVYELGFYNGNLAYNNNGTKGIYMIPEPMSLALLALGGLVGLRRRR